MDRIKASAVLIVDCICACLHLCANGLIKFGNRIVNQSLSLNSSICIFIAIKPKGDNFIHTNIIAPVVFVIQFKLSNDACYEH